MLDFFFVRLDRRNIKIRCKDIVYIESCRNYLFINMVKEKLMILLSMRQMEEMLPMDQFIRLHKSFIVSVEHIESFDFHTAYLTGNRSVPIGESYRQVIHAKYKVLTQEVRRVPAHITAYEILDSKNN